MRRVVNGDGQDDGYDLVGSFTRFGAGYQYSVLSEHCSTVRATGRVPWS